MSSLVVFLPFLVFVLGGCDSDVGGPNRAPVAVAGPDADAALGTLVALDGSGSYDPDGDALSYTWQVLSRPEHSTVEPLDAGSRQTSLQVDVGGVYLVALVVFDGQAYSERDVMQIRAAGCENNAECEDAFFCTVNERCEDGLCLSDTKNCEAAGDDCNAGVCDEASTSCLPEALPNDTPCTDDDLFCTGVEICRSGACVSAGNPCDPTSSCDESAEACGGCGDGEVLGSEECDPGAPQNDNCCDAATCRWVVAGEADPQADCSGATGCQTDVCDGEGNCDVANAEDGTACGDSTNRLCDDPDSCLAGQCETNLAGTDILCRAEAAGCDAAEYCDGVNPECPQDLAKEAAVPCRAPAGICDAEEVCDGVNASCPADLRVEADTECRGSTDADCDPAENCDGVLVDCPADAVLANDTPCTDDGDFCTGLETCQLGVCTNGGNPCPTHDDCDETNDICGSCGDGVVGDGEECDPGAPLNDNCCNVGDCSFTSLGFVDPQGLCSGAGECRVDVCDGLGDCTDAVAGDGADCGSNNDTLCDNPDSCLNGACQENLEASDTLCRSSTGPCDPEENCDGSSADCPSDQLDDGSLECRPSQGDCDPAEFCDGSSAGCPGNAMAGFGDECRASEGDCDLAEDCDGVNAACPEDAMAGSNVECRPVAGDCDLAENCAGGVDCPEDVMAGSSVECRPVDGVCDLAENCAGGVDCPDDGFLPSSSECRGVNGLCDVAESCPGDGPNCPTDDFLVVDTVCRLSSNADCDPAEVCTGLGPACPDEVYTDEDTPCTDSSLDDCLLAECDGAGVCVQGHGIALFGASCDGGDPCLSGDTCGDGDGVCYDGVTSRDIDDDGHVDDACGGNDCDDSDPDVFLGAPAEGSGNICDAAGSCFDGVDNDCDGNTDSDDPDCPASDYMCLYGPGSNLETGGAGGTLTVRLDTAGYNPDDIVCYTDTSRLLTPEVLFENDFEENMSNFTVSDGIHVRRIVTWAQNPATNSSGDYGVITCRDHWLMTDAIDTTGRTHIQLRYASKVRMAMDADDYFVTEYSIGDSTWYQLDIQGDNFRENWQWFTHVLPIRCENQSTLYIRWRVVSGDENDDCGFVDDVEVVELPDPTVSWTLLDNDFEEASGNAAAGNCGDDGPWLLALFDLIGPHPDKICLVTEAQNPLSVAGDAQGLRINDNWPGWIRDTDIDTQYVPTGSDLVVDFYMQSDHQGADDYSNAWYSYNGGTTWKRMNGVGLNAAEVYDRFRFVMDPEAIDRTDLMVEFLVPAAADSGPGDGFYLDDYDLTWFRASHDEIGAFTDEGGGIYTATMTSDLDGTANVTCIYHGDPGTEVTDGLDGNSSPEPVVFEP